MNKYKKIKTILPVLAVFLIAGLVYLFAFGGNQPGSAYLINATNSAVTDTITTAGDSADASYTFENKDNKWQYLIVEYIQAAAPIKSLVVAGDNVYGLKMTYDEADSTLKLWSQRQLGWVQLGFYVQTTSAETQTTTGTLSGNDTTTGTVTGTGTITGTITVVSNDTTTGIITIASNDTLAGVITLAYTETQTGTITIVSNDTTTGTISILSNDTLSGTVNLVANDTLAGTVTTMANDTLTGTVAIVGSDTNSIIVQGTGTYLCDSIRVIDVERTHTYNLVNDGSGTNTYDITSIEYGTYTYALVNDVEGTHTYALVNDIAGSQTYALLNTVAGTHTYALVNDVEGTETYVLVNDVAGTQTYALVTGETNTYALINDKLTNLSQSTTITKTDPNTIVYEIVVTPDSGTSTCIFTVRGTNYLVGY